MEKYYSFAGVELSVRTAPELMYEEDRLLAPFRVQKVKEPHRFTFTRVPQFSAPEGELQAVQA